MKRILIMSDFHCGHQFGFAHPDDCVNDVQKRGWKFVEEGLRKYVPFDTLFLNGDLIDGNGRKNGGIELITSDRLRQCDMAIKIIKAVGTLGKNLPECYFTRGTPYHTGEGEDFENIIAKAFAIPGNDEPNIKESMLVEVEGVVFDLKHKVGGGSMPYTKATPIMKDLLMCVMKERLEGRPEANVVVRSHTHSYVCVEAMNKLGVITPGLEINSAYGQRQCSGMVDFGFLIFEVEDGKILKRIVWKSEQPIMQEKVVKACAEIKKGKLK